MTGWLLRPAIAAHYSGAPGQWGASLAPAAAAPLEAWVARYNSSDTSSATAYAVAVDPAGNVYVTGSAWASGTANDYATIKYNSAGTQQWLARYNSAGTQADWATALAIDPAGNVYVTGYVDGGSWSDYGTMKYDTNGNQLWVARYNGPYSGLDDATALAVDAAGNVYVTGHSEVAGGYYDYATIKYNSAGAEQWVVRYNGPGNAGSANALAVDATGNVYVTGESAAANTTLDYVTIKYVPQAVACPTIAGLKAKIAAYAASGDIKSNLVNSLVSKLDAAQASLDRGNTNSFQGQMNAFINQVQAQKGKGISAAAANNLIATALAILANGGHCP